MSDKRIVVCGATGNQGKAVVASLLAKGGWEVVALSRSPDGEAARELAGKGARAMRADLLDKASLVEAFRGAAGVFGVTQPWSPGYKKCDVRAEVQQGKNIVDACLEAKVPHLVLTTVLILPGDKLDISHVDSKLEIEAYARAAKVPMTILRPGQFMDNIGLSIFPVKRGTVKGLVAGDAKVPSVACADIGALAAVAFERSAEFIGKEVPAVGELVSGDEIAATLCKLRRGERFRYKAVPGFVLWFFAREIYAMKRAFETLGRPPYPREYEESRAETHRLCAEPTTVEKFLRGKGYESKLLA